MTTLTKRLRVYRTDAIILRRSDWGEADRIVTLFTPGFGKLRVVAPGARKPQSRKSGHLELFTHGTYVLARGRTFDKLTQAETRDYFPRLHESLDRMSCASLAAELVDRFVEEHDENAPLYELFLDTLAILDDPARSPDPLLALRYFEVRALTLLGYQPQVHHCILCGEPLEPVDQFFNLGGGGVVCPRCAAGQKGLLHLPLDLLKVLRFFQDRLWGEVRGLQLPAATMAGLETLLRRYVASLLERDLKSEKFLRELRRPYTSEEPPA
ncbi:MAG: DNA repair protein RecO [Ardenticatenaceae bacterium]|nr:DNA repair protein RecO [Ardenticatenaceae bacterium]